MDIKKKSLINGEETRSLTVYLGLPKKQIWTGLPVPILRSWSGHQTTKIRGWSFLLIRECRILKNERNMALHKIECSHFVAMAILFKY